MVAQALKPIHYFVFKDRGSFFKVGVIGDKDKANSVISSYSQDVQYVDTVTATATHGRNINGINFVYCKYVTSPKAGGVVG
jgi:hypothetical protein